MGLFETLPQVSATSSAFTLSSEIVSADTLNIFVFALIGGIIVGFTFAIFKKATTWVWR